MVGNGKILCLLGVCSFWIFVSCLEIKNERHQFADYAAQLMDSVIKYHRDGNMGLCNDNDPVIKPLIADNVAAEERALPLWPYARLFSAVNAMAVAQHATNYDVWTDTVLFKAFRQYDDFAKVSADSSDSFYDDSSWLGIGYVEHYNRTHNSASLVAAEKIWRFLENGSSTYSYAPATVLAL